jgi:hypothetical protein
LSTPCGGCTSVRYVHHVLFCASPPLLAGFFSTSRPSLLDLITHVLFILGFLTLLLLFVLVSLCNSCCKLGQELELPFELVDGGSHRDNFVVAKGLGSVSIPTRNVYAVTQHFAHKKEFYIFKFPERFLEIS